MNSPAEYTQARQNLHSLFRFFSIAMLLAGLGVIPAIIAVFLSPGILTILLAPGLAIMATVFALLRLKAGTEIDHLAIQAGQQVEATEANLDRELAVADPALGVILRVGEQ